jgi:hypothetical protein
MQIGEIARRTSLTVDAIRFYEKPKLPPKADRSAGRLRLYTEGIGGMQPVHAPCWRRPRKTSDED